MLVDYEPFFSHEPNNHVKFATNKVMVMVFTIFVAGGLVT
jgi:hypothetical protein